MYSMFTLYPMSLVITRRKHMQVFRCFKDGARRSDFSQMRFDITTLLNKILSQLFNKTYICFHDICFPYYDPTLNALSNIYTHLWPESEQETRIF